MVSQTNVISADDDLPWSLVTVKVSMPAPSRVSPLFTSLPLCFNVTKHWVVYLSDHEATVSPSIRSRLSAISTFPQSKTFNSCLTTVRLGNTSSRTRVTEAVLLLPASSVTVRVSVHDFLVTSPEVTAAPSKVTLTVQLLVTSSVHVATSLSPTCSSLPLIRIFSTPMMSRLLSSTVMVGGVVSATGVGVGTGGVGLSVDESSCVQLAMTATAIHATRNSFLNVVK